MVQRLDELFKGRHFEREIIVLCVRWYYLRYKLSLRDQVEMMAERPGPGPHDHHALGAALRARVRKALETIRPRGWSIMARR